MNVLHHFNKSGIPVGEPDLVVSRISRFLAEPNHSNYFRIFQPLGVVKGGDIDNIPLRSTAPYFLQSRFAGASGSRSKRSKSHKRKRSGDDAHMEDDEDTLDIYNDDPTPRRSDVGFYGASMVHMVYHLMLRWPMYQCSCEAWVDKLCYEVKIFVCSEIKSTEGSTRRSGESLLESLWNQRYAKTGRDTSSWDCKKWY